MSSPPSLSAGVRQLGPVPCRRHALLHTSSFGPPPTPPLFPPSFLRSKVEDLVAKGAKAAATPAEVAANSDIVFTMVGYPSDVRDVILGPSGVLASLREGGIVVDMTTSEPSLAVEIDAAAKAKGVGSLDAPVSGGDIGAREARLSIMCGGSAATFASVLPLFQVMGKNIKLLGGPGCGQHTKMVNQILIATNMIGVCEGLLYAYQAGLNPEEVIEAVGAGAAGSWSVNNLGPRIVKGNFEPGFFVEHFIKDLGIALAEATRMKLDLPGLALGHRLYLELQAQGGARKGTQALFLALQKLNGVAHVPYDLSAK
jgi:3-hydroxyisobutyrate dehydrogenase